MALQTLKQFIDTNNGKFVERVDSTNKNQCMDLAIAYCEDVLGLTRNIFSGNLYAYQVFEKPTDLASKNFDFIKNTAYAVPKQGDILVFKFGVAGHIVVVESANTNSIRAFSQNDPTGSPCIMKTYNYDYVLGWLRSITKPLYQEDIAVLEQKIKDLEETEKRLILEKDQAIREGEAKLVRELANHSIECQKKIDNYKAEVLKLAEKFKAL